MKKSVAAGLLAAALSFPARAFAGAPAPVGEWATVDDTSGVGVTERDTCSDADVANPEWIQGTLPPERLGERFPHEPHDDAATAVGCERRRVDGHDSR